MNDSSIATTKLLLNQRDKEAFELKIHNDVLVAKLENFEETITANAFINLSTPIETARNRVVDSQKQRIINQAESIAKLAGMLQQTDKSNSDLVKNALLLAKNVEDSHQISFESKKNLDHANELAFQYLVLILLFLLNLIINLPL